MKHQPLVLNIQSTGRERDGTNRVAPAPQIECPSLSSRAQHAAPSPVRPAPTPGSCVHCSLNMFVMS
jgi:hypothetical protein